MKNEKKLEVCYNYITIMKQYYPLQEQKQVLPPRDIMALQLICQVIACIIQLSLTQLLYVIDVEVSNCLPSSTNTATDRADNHACMKDANASDLISISAGSLLKSLYIYIVYMYMYMQIMKTWNRANCNLHLLSVMMIPFLPAIPAYKVNISYCLRVHNLATVCYRR